MSVQQRSGGVCCCYLLKAVMSSAFLCSSTLIIINPFTTEPGYWLNKDLWKPRMEKKTHQALNMLNRSLSTCRLLMFSCIWQQTQHTGLAQKAAGSRLLIDWWSSFYSLPEVDDRQDYVRRITCGYRGEGVHLHIINSSGKPCSEIKDLN